MWVANVVRLPSCGYNTWWVSPPCGNLCCAAVFNSPKSLGRVKRSFWCSSCCSLNEDMLFRSDKTLTLTLQHPRCGCHCLQATSSFLCVSHLEPRLQLLLLSPQRPPTGPDVLQPTENYPLTASGYRPPLEVMWHSWPWSGPVLNRCEPDEVLISNYKYVPDISESNLGCFFGAEMQGSQKCIIWMKP